MASNSLFSFEVFKMDNSMNLGFKKKKQDPEVTNLKGEK